MTLADTLDALALVLDDIETDTAAAESDTTEPPSGTPAPTPAPA